MSPRQDVAFNRQPLCPIHPDILGIAPGAAVLGCIEINTGWVPSSHAKSESGVSRSVVACGQPGAGIGRVWRFPVVRKHCQFVWLYGNDVDDGYGDWNNPALLDHFVYCRSQRADGAHRGGLLGLGQFELGRGHRHQRLYGNGLQRLPEHDRRFYPGIGQSAQLERNGGNLYRLQPRRLDLLLRHRSRGLLRAVFGIQSGHGNRHERDLINVRTDFQHT